MNGVMAQDNTGYQLPPKDIADLLLAKPTPAISVDRKGEWMLLVQRASYPPVEELAQPELRIAGLRINPNNYTLSRQNFANDFSLKNLRTGKEYKVEGLPSPLRAGNITWNPSESRIAFTNTTNKAVELYVIDIATARASMGAMAQAVVLAGLGATPEGKTLSDAVGKFIGGAKSISVTATAKDPAGLSAADLAAAQTDPTTLSGKVTVDASAQ